MSYSIITHNGKPHIDEVIAISLLALHKGELPRKIKRLNHETACGLIKRGLISKKLFYIDCGMDFNIEKNIFDHHQDMLPSSALLIYNHFYSNKKIPEIESFLQKLSDVDNHGPKILPDFTTSSESIEYFKFPLKLILELFTVSPIQVIDLFKKSLEILVSKTKFLELARKWLKDVNNISIKSYKNINILKYNKPPPRNISSYVKSLDGEIIEKNQIDITYSFDKDNRKIRTLFRTFNGDNKVNFKSAEITNPIFNHNSGFLLKFIPNSQDEWLKIINNSLIDKEEKND